MSPKVFDYMSWKDISQVLATKPRMYQLWYGKQCSGYCGTSQMIFRWEKTVKASYPNVGRFERVVHLNLNPSTERRLLPQRSIAAISK